MYDEAEKEQIMKKKNVIGVKAVLRQAAAFLLAFLVLTASVGIDPQEAAAAKTPKNGIVLKEKSVTLYAGEYTTIRQVGAYQNGTMIAWEGNLIPHQSLKYTSSNKKVATVNSKGVVTAKKKGTAKITVASIFNSKVKATFTVKVTKNKQNAKITLKKTKATLEVGKSTTIAVKSLKGLSTKTLKYTSSNKKVATVNSKGKVTAKKAGTATITITSPVNKKVKATFQVTVKTKDLLNTEHSPKGKAKIVLEKTSVTLYQKKDFTKIYNGQAASGESHREFSVHDKSGFEGFGCAPDVYKQVKAVYDKYGYSQIKIRRITGLKSTAVTYKSSNTGVAKVSATGRIEPQKAGTATITVTSKENKKVSATYKVTVKACDTILAVDMSYPTNIKFYAQRTPETWTDKEGNVYPAGQIEYRSLGRHTLALAPKKSVAHLYTSLTGCECGKNLRFICTSSNENVIKVVGESDSMLRFYTVGKGETTLTIKTQDGKFSYSWKCTVSDKNTRYSDGLVDEMIDSIYPAEEGWVTDISKL